MQIWSKTYINTKMKKPGLQEFVEERRAGWEWKHFKHNMWEVT